MLHVFYHIGCKESITNTSRKFMSLIYFHYLVMPYSKLHSTDAWSILVEHLIKMFRNINYNLVIMQVTKHLEHTYNFKEHVTNENILFSLRKGNSVQSFARSKATYVSNVLYLPKGNNICCPHELSYVFHTFLHYPYCRINLSSKVCI